MDSETDLAGFEGDFFGICHKCGKPILGDSSGCQAMGELYHVDCFCCATCKQTLRGKQFYTLNDQPICEQDYLETLTKCKVCNLPICDRILTADSGSFHPECFKCEICAKSLDDVPFTITADGKIHCLDDYYELHAPKCATCKLIIKPQVGSKETVRIVAMDQSYHVDCYRCEDCKVALSSEVDGGVGCYPLNGTILCKSCNTTRQRSAISSVNY